MSKRRIFEYRVQPEGQAPLDTDRGNRREFIVTLAKMERAGGKRVDVYRRTLGESWELTRY